MRYADCKELKNLKHTQPIAIADGLDRKFIGEIHYEPESVWNYARINVYLELEKKFFFHLNTPYKVPYVEIPCENCSEVKRQMLYIATDEIDDVFKEQILKSLMSQINEEKEKK